MERFLIKKSKDDQKSSMADSPKTESRAEPSTSKILHSDSSEEEIESNIDEPKLKKKKIYAQKFKKEWMDLFPWLEKKGDNGKSFCKACNKSISGGIKHLHRHAETEAHKRNILKAAKTPKMHTYFKNNDDISKSVKSAEFKLTMFLHEHNLPFLLMDHLILLLSVVCPDSQIAKQLRCARTKTTSLTGTIADEQTKNLSEMFQKTFFSIIIDESTDVSNKKSLVVVARYFDNIQNRCCDAFLGLIRVFNADAESLFTAVCSYLEKLKIPINNLIGLAADNATVMMGNISGVQARFRRILPNIFVLGCVCHSFHLCSSAASKKLPRSLEDFIRSIYNYFSHSSKRSEKLQEFQKFMDLKPHKMLHPAQTRWLSLQACVDRVLENWDALKLFFHSEYLDEDLHSTKGIVDSLENPIFKVYLTFLSYVLEQVNKLNLEFQSEKPKLHWLLKRTSDLYRSILRNYISKSILDQQNLNDIDPKNPRNFLPLEKVFFGAKTEIILQKENINLQEITNFKLRALDFYVELAKQIKTRFNFENPRLKFVSLVLDPDVAMSGDEPSIVGGALQYFPNLVYENNIERLNSEWRMLSDVSDLKKIDTSTAEGFWSEVLNLKNEIGGEMFSSLKYFISGLLALPHSSAAAERVFSKVNLLKTKLRNKLEIDSINNILHCKENLGKNCCYSWEPTKSLLSRKIVYK